MQEVSSPIIPMENVPQSAVPIKYAGFWVRVAASIIDGIAVMILVSIPYFVFEGKGVTYTVLTYVLAWGYVVFMIGRFQATLGKMAVGLRVERTDKSRIGFGRAFLREIVGKILSSVTLFVGYLMIVLTEKRQGLHDKIADTVVVEKDPSKSKMVWKVLAMVIVFGMLAMLAFSLFVLVSILPEVLGL